jgi:uncharacterized protein
MDGDEQRVAARLVAAIRSGDVAIVEKLLAASPALATERVHGGRTALHVVADWPGYFPNGPQIARRLLAAGADPNAVTQGKGAPETALHWAASSDDVDVAEVLIAVGYGCWQVARLLVARGARVEHLWQAAGLGLSGRVEELLAAGPDPDAREVTEAFWQACAGGQRRTAMLLRARGADVNGRPGYAGRSAIEAAAGPDTGRDLLVGWLRDHGATIGGG